MVSTELQAMLSSDERHWWYSGRRRVVRAELDRLLGPGDARRVLDAGCGSGRNLDELSDYGVAVGVDASHEAVAVARSRGHEDVHEGTVEELPFPDGGFDLVTCLDVVEHTPDDHRTLRELRRVTRPGGLALVTVPAYPVLWSAHDVVNGHHRRYRRATLHAAAREAGWDLVADTHFNGAVLPAAVVVRLWGRMRGRAAGGRSELTITPARLDGLLELPLRLEAALVGRGARLPAGLSLMAAYRNPAATRNETEGPRPGAGRGAPQRATSSVTTGPGASRLTASLAPSAWASERASERPMP
jgi:SAM-dependent methyltransferase